MLYLREKLECICKKNSRFELEQPFPAFFSHLEPLYLCQRVGLDDLPHVGLWVHQHEGQLGGQLAPNSAQEELDLDYFLNKKIGLIQDLCIPEKKT